VGTKKTHKARPLPLFELFILCGGSKVIASRLLGAAQGSKEVHRAILKAIIDSPENPMDAKTKKRFREIDDDEAARILHQAAKGIVEKNAQVLA